MIPSDFVDLRNALSKANVQHNVIGVCFDFLPAKKSQGTDYTIKFRLHDPSWIGSGGMEFRFFHRDQEHLPRIEHQGDVVILRNFQTRDRNGRFGLSSFSSEWIVLPLNKMDGTLDDIKSAAIWSRQSRAMYAQSSLSMAELQYAKYISEQEDPSQWPALTSAADALTSNNMQDIGGQLPPRKQKFTEIKDIQLPKKGGLLYVELLGEIRKIFSTDSRTELSITDYTSHPLLYDYHYGGDEDGRDGDQFGYIKDDLKLWPGPWGTMTMSVTLWDAHHYFAVSSIKEGDFVYLRNIRIGLDRSESRLEGRCNGDKQHPSKVNVELRKAKDANQDELVKNLLRRKREYEAKAAAENLRFLRDARSKKRKLEAEGHHSQEENHKSKKTRARDRKKKNRRARAEPEDETIKPTIEQAIPQHILNLNVRCLNHDVPCKTIADILDTSILQRKTPSGNLFSVPFQNCKYKSKIRVVDFFPDNVEDFAVPQKESDYDYLSDRSSDPESDVNLSQVDTHRVKWVWRFFLLVEDSQPQQRNGETSAQMQLLVADSDGEFLLNQEAFDMRDERNKVELARTKEKLFHLWGDLQEWKEEARTLGMISRTSQARPFECLIKEYGAKVPSYLRSSQKRGATYERIFRMFGVTI
jgi:protection-of-telomeres protein 1